MTNQHSFDVIPKGEHDVESVKNNERSFSSIIRNSKFYSIVVNTFSASQTLFANIHSATSIVVNSFTATLRATAGIVSTMTVEITSLYTNVKMSAEVQMEAVVEFIFSFAQNMGVAEFLLPTKFESWMKTQINIGATNEILLPITVESAPLYKKYYFVSDWDASLLSDLDGNNLIDMDFQYV